MTRKRESGKNGTKRKGGECEAVLLLLASPRQPRVGVCGGGGRGRKSKERQIIALYRHGNRGRRDKQSAQEDKSGQGVKTGLIEDTSFGSVDAGGQAVSDFRSSARHEADKECCEPHPC